MTIITSEELSKFRTALQKYGEVASQTFNTIDECSGNLEEAMEIIMINAGMEPVRGDADWLDNFVKKLRNFICDPDFKDFIVDGAFASALEYLLAKTNYLANILILVIVYIFKKGLKYFCS